MNKPKIYVAMDASKDLKYYEEFKQMVSAKNEYSFYDGIDYFKELDKIEQQDMTYLTNARSIALLKQVYEKIKEIEESINKNVPISIIELDLRSAWEILGQIIGEHYQDELIDQLFTQFCLGK